MVARMVEVLPAPGEAMRSSTKTPASSNRARFSAARLLVAVEDRLAEVDFHAHSSGASVAGSGSPAASSASKSAAVVGLDAVDLQLPPGQRLDVEAAARRADHLEPVVARTQVRTRGSGNWRATVVTTSVAPSAIVPGVSDSNANWSANSWISVSSPTVMRISVMRCRPGLLGGVERRLEDALRDAHLVHVRPFLAQRGP